MADHRQEVMDWAKAHKLSDATLGALQEEGYDSLDALKLFDQTDLKASTSLKKLPLGQKKLLMHSTAKLQGDAPRPTATVEIQNDENPDLTSTPAPTSGPATSATTPGIPGRHR